MEARGIYWLIVALHGITPEKIEDIPDAFGVAGAAARPPEAFSRGENTCVFLS